MNYKALAIQIICLMSLTVMLACTSQNKIKMYDTIEQTESAIAKQHKKDAKLAAKESRKAYKIHWKNQTKQTKGSIKKNKKRMKKNKRKDINIHATEQ